MPGQRRTYTKRQKATAVLAAEMASVEAAAEATGIPRTTIDYWLDQPEFVALRHKARESLAEEMVVIARLAAQKLAEALRSGTMEPRDVITALGVATDKSQLLSGGATSRTETRDLTEGMSDHERDALADAIDEWLASRDGAEPAAAGAPPADG